jgi:hypothetical protein
LSLCFIKAAVLARFGVVAVAFHLVELGIDLLEASDSQLLHLLVGAHVVFGEFFLAEDDVEA